MLTLANNIKQVRIIIAKYNLPKNEQKYIWHFIYPIFKHKEFQRRMDPTIYPHHSKISLGSHLISDTILTYLMCKKQKLTEEETELSMTIAMFHDLYEYPWQNSDNKKSFENLHGFVHPIESAINAITWYPEYFEDKKRSEIIIDGIIHHMYPLPVRSFDNANMELNNQEKFDNLDEDLKRIIIKSTLRKKVGHLSICRSKYLYGRIVSDADKRVSIIKELNSVKSIKACVTGKNNELINNK